MHGWLISLAMLVIALPATADDLATCLELNGPERARCFNTWVAAAEIDAERFRSVRALVETHPVQAVDLLSRLGSGSRRPALDAALLDLEGQARLASDDAAGAARAFEEALALDDGTTRVDWVSRSRSWQTRLDVGNGRVLRAADGFLAAGRADEAHRWLSLALELGAEPGAAAEWKRLGETLDSPLRQRDPLEVLQWFPPLPALDVELTDGEAFPLAGAMGQVLVLNFWATWCKPCITELGHLQHLYDEDRERGLEILAVNAQEPIHLVVPYVKEMGLTMPIGRYSPALDEEFEVNTLPTMVVADRLGRIRGRWVGYEDGREREVIDLVQALLTNDPPRRRVAEVRTGAGAMRVSWLRDLRARVEGLTVAETPGGPRIVVAHGIHLGVFRPDGVTETRVDGSRIAGQMVAGVTGDDGSYPVFAFHRGSSQVVRFDMPEGGFETWEAPAPVFDLATGWRDGVLLLGTRDGLYRVGTGGDEPTPVDGFALVTGVARGPEGDGFAVLEAGRRLTWLDDELAAVDRLDVTGASWFLAMAGAADGLVATVPTGVVATARGRFLGDGTQLAVATRSGQLILLDIVSGEPRFRADWAGIGNLHAADLDADGRDELILAAGTELAVLSAAGDSTTPHGK